MRYAILLILLLTMAVPVAAFEQVENVSVKFSELPVTYSFDVTFPLQVGENATFLRTDTNNELVFIFPDNVVLSNDTNVTTNATIQVDVQINKPSSNGNKTIEGKIQINRSNQSTLDHAIVGVFMQDDTPDPVISVTDGDFTVTIQRDDLPQAGSLEYELNGKPGADITIACPEDQWIDCPKELRFADNGQLRFKIQYDLPTNTSIGTYDRRINFTSNGNQTHTTVRFIIEYEDLDFQQFDFPDNCIVEFGDQERAIKLNCVRQAEANILDDMAEISRQSIEASQKLISNSFNLSNQELANCKDDKLAMSEQLTNLGILVDQANQARTQAEEALRQNETACLATVFERSVKLKQEAEDLEKELKSRFWWRTFWLFIALIVFGLIAYWYWYKKHHRW